MEGNPTGQAQCQDQDLLAIIDGLNKNIDQLKQRPLRAGRGDLSPSPRLRGRDEGPLIAELEEFDGVARPDLALVGFRDVGVDLVDDRAREGIKTPTGWPLDEEEVAGAGAPAAMRVYRLAALPVSALIAARRRIGQASLSYRLRLRFVHAEHNMITCRLGCPQAAFRPNPR
jgi:hypothetical protein